MARNLRFLALSTVVIAFSLALKFLPARVFAQSPVATSSATIPQKQEAQIHALKITVLSTMLVGDSAGIGEWGFSALVEADGHRILLDTGSHPDTVLQNARDLNIDLSDVKEVILTHNHWDHVHGLRPFAER